MVNRNANIDLLFRNGLKDYEVLPPAGVWSEIKPVIRKHQLLLIYLRTAAAVILILSVSFLAYRLGRENISLIKTDVAVLNTDQFVVQDEVPLLVEESAIYDNNMPQGSGTDHTIAPAQNDTSTTDYQASQRRNQRLISRVAGMLQGNRSDELQRNLIARSEINEADVTSYFNDISVRDYLVYPVTPKIDRWSVTAMASPTYYPRPQVNNNGISKQMGSSEQSRLSYSGGVAFAYRISRKLSVQSGLYYSSIGQEVGDIYSFGGFGKYIYTKSDRNFEVMTSAGRIYTENADIFLRDGIGDRVLTRYTNDVFDPAKASLQYMSSSLYQSFSYIEMPLILRYKLLDKDIDINLVGGVSYNFLVNNAVYTRFDGNRLDVGKTDGLNQFMLSSSLGMGMEYNLSDRFSLNLEPTFRYYMNPFSDTQGLKAHPYSFGIFSGLSYKF